MLVLTAFGAALEPMAHSRLTVNKADPRQHVGHEGLAPGDPDVARGGDLGALLLGGLQVFFWGPIYLASQSADPVALPHGAWLTQV